MNSWTLREALCCPAHGTPVKVSRLDSVSYLAKAKALAIFKPPVKPRLVSSWSKWLKGKYGIEGGIVRRHTAQILVKCYPPICFWPLDKDEIRDVQHLFPVL